MNAPLAQDTSHRLLLRCQAMRSRVIGRLVILGWSEADAEDLFSQALLRAWDASSTLRDEAATEGWFWRIAHRLAVDAARKNSRRKTVADSDAIALAAAPEEPAPACSCSLDRLDELPQDLRALVQAVDIDGVAVREAAAHAGITPNNASVRLFRARRSMRARMYEVCGTSSASACQDCDCAC